MDKAYLGYNFACPIQGSVLPQRVQNLCIRDYAQSKKLTLSFNVSEYFDVSRSLMLFAQFEHIESVEGFIFYSLMILPPDPERRERFYKVIADHGKKVHFALEDLVLDGARNTALIERLYRINSDKRLEETRDNLIAMHRKEKAAAPSNAIFNQESVIAVRQDQIEDLKKRSVTADRQVFRLCLHSAPEEKLHQMLIIHQKDAYVKPHKHLEKSESFHVVEGELDVFLFDDTGAITRKIEMGEYRSGKPFCYRLSAPTYHTVLPRSQQVVFHEITDGPFVRAETVFSPWSPEEKDRSAVELFLKRLRDFTGAAI